jgi:hypothetical protein
MVKKKCLEVGYGWDKPSFERLYGKPEDEIVSELRRIGEPPASCHTHKLFLNLRPGDWVAVKKYCAPRGNVPVLVINGYAKVVQRGGIVYFKGQEPLYHCVHADFLEHGNEYTFRRSYGGAMHRLADPEIIRQIFGPVLGKKIPKLEVAPPQRAQWRRVATLLSTLENQTRQTKASKIKIQQAHHRIRNRLYKQLVRQHGEENVYMEQDFVDIQVSDGKTLSIYEIKPYRSVLKCVREALGQVLLYAWHEATIQQQKLKLIVVGPTRPTKDEELFIAFVKRAVKMDFDYLPVE